MGGGDREFVSEVHPGEKTEVVEGIVKIWIYFLLSHSDLMRKLSSLPKSSLFACDSSLILAHESFAIFSLLCAAEQGVICRHLASRHGQPTIPSDNSTVWSDYWGALNKISYL